MQSLFLASLFLSARSEKSSGQRIDQIKANQRNRGEPRSLGEQTSALFLEDLTASEQDEESGACIELGVVSWSSGRETAEWWP